MNKPYILTKGASADLEEIVRHTSAQWGATKCRSYVGQLEKAAIALARADGVFKDLSSLYPQLRMAKSGRHYLFCLPRPDAPPVILAILHERMDMLARLKSRLT